MSVLEQHPQWPAVLKIHQQLTQAGYRSLIAGGAVRDLMLSRTPNDIDIATDATPEQVEEMFEKTVMVGKAFGVSRVIIDGHDIEVATFRKDGEYKDGRKPESVTFCSEKEDALRRDFTINALFYDPAKKEIIDYVGGQKDIMQRTLRAVGDPNLRFKEDKLRILRGVRFHAQLDFPIEQPTQDAMKAQVSSLNQVSMERISDEWIKLLMGEYVLQGLTKCYDLKIWNFLFPDWSYQAGTYRNVFAKKIEDPDMFWALWALLHLQESKEKIAQWGFQWKLPKDLIKKILYIYQGLPLLRKLNKVEPVDVAIFLSQNYGRDCVQAYRVLNGGKIKQDWEDRLRDGESFFKGAEKLPEPLVDGDDLIRFGMSPGPKIADKLKELYRNQLKYGVTLKEDLLKKLI